MTDHTAAPDGWTFPEEWTEEARGTVSEVIAARPDLTGAAVGILESVGYLLTAAHHAYAAAEAADFIAVSDRGGRNLHGGLAESRQARNAAVAALRTLLPADSGANAGTIAGAALARRRYRRA